MDTKSRNNFHRDQGLWQDQKKIESLPSWHIRESAVRSVVILSLSGFVLGLIFIHGKLSIKNCWFIWFSSCCLTCSRHPKKQWWFFFSSWTICEDIFASRKLFTQQNKLEKLKSHPMTKEKQKERIFLSFVVGWKNVCFCFDTEISSQMITRLWLIKSTLQTWTIAKKKRRSDRTIKSARSLTKWTKLQGVAW